MNWTHSSKTAALVVLLAISLAASGTAAAVSFSGDAPEAKKVGESVEMKVTMESAFEDPLPNKYTLQADTALENASWTIRAKDVTGETIKQVDVAKSTAKIQLNGNKGIDQVVIIVNGEVPQMSTFNYRNIEKEKYTAMKLSRVVDNGLSPLDGGTWKAHRYTEKSKKARDTIEAAQEAVNASGNQKAKEDLKRAINSYNSGNFQNAIGLAKDAKSTAKGSAQTTQLLLIGASVVVLVGIVGGGAYVWKQRQQDTSKLR